MCFLNNCKRQKSYRILLEDWNSCIKVKISELNEIKEKSTFIVNVNFCPELGEKYEGKFISASASALTSLSNDDINPSDLLVISQNKSAIFMCEDSIVGGVLRQVTSNKVANYYGSKTKTTVEAYPKIKRGKAHAGEGTLVGHGKRKEFLGSHSGSYVYNNNSKLNPEAKKIFDSNGDSLAKWLYDNVRRDMPWITKSYEDFKKAISLDDNEIIGALFCSKNYMAMGHRDDDRSEWALGFVYEEGVVKKGIFFYPDYGVAIEMSFNSIWYWKTNEVHDIAKLNLSEGGTKYTVAISLTERTAKSIEREKGLI